MRVADLQALQSLQNATQPSGPGATTAGAAATAPLQVQGAGFNPLSWVVNQGANPFSTGGLLDSAIGASGLATPGSALEFAAFDSVPFEAISASGISPSASLSGIVSPMLLPGLFFAGIGLMGNRNTEEWLPLLHGSDTVMMHGGEDAPVETPIANRIWSAGEWSDNEQRRPISGLMSGTNYPVYESPFGQMRGPNDPAFGSFMNQLIARDEQLAATLTPEEISQVSNSLSGAYLVSDAWEPGQPDTARQYVSDLVAERDRIISDAIGRPVNIPAPGNSGSAQNGFQGLLGWSRS